ncbi:hypothetical protein GCM10010211_71110 [Streptomyces albospinus]|uniref:Uncharacterized protein n=1 Tax=Streptomyces albospinus TaxID=285515 RepID=A0ABQ2VKG1_9ACTN|nr:hypothetical protein GCM10010211_71110 [Streptomyces albospinus]
MGPLEFAGEELQADVARLQLLCEHGQVDAAAEPLVLVHDEGDAHARRAELPTHADGLLQLRRLGGPGGALLPEDADDPRLAEGVEQGVEGSAGAERREAGHENLTEAVADRTGHADRAHLSGSTERGRLAGSLVLLRRLLDLRRPDRTAGSEQAGPAINWG